MTLPSRITTLELPALYRNTIGLDRLVDNMLNIADRGPAGYPPYNVISVDDNNYLIEIACAGFTDKDINVLVNNGDLHITGVQQEELNEDVEKSLDRKFLHRGISARKWERTFTLADYVEVKGATITNGMLTIELERVIPEALKPRQIPITVK